MTPFDAIFNVAGKVIERVWPDPAQQAEASRKLAELKQRGDLAFLDADVKLLAGQLEINKMEAQHGGLFKGGWRPFIGWTCGVALAYHFVVQPLVIAVVSISAFYIGGNEAVFPTALLPKLDTPTLMSILMSMLGIGTMRTYEKRKTQASVSG